MNRTTWERLDREVKQLASQDRKELPSESDRARRVDSFETLVRFVGGDRAEARALVDEVNDWADNKIGKNEYRALPKAFLDVADKGKNPGPGYWAFIASRA
jgi:hypothetical protein